MFGACRDTFELSTLPPVFKARTGNVYTAQIEPFGLDEAWLDVTGDKGILIADDISNRIKRELGVISSLGVSYNKIFAG